MPILTIQDDNTEALEYSSAEFDMLIYLFEPQPCCLSNVLVSGLSQLI